MKIFAHRGDSGNFPENTMTAFEQAVKSGCDGIELDVQMTKDQRLVVIHDETLKRTTGAEGFVRDYTLSELKKMDAGQVRKGECGVHRIPEFEEYCDFAKDHNIVTNIEIKTGIYYYQEIEEKVLEVLKNYHLEDKILFSSFNHLSIMHLKSLAPDIPCGVLVGQTGLGNAGYYCSRYQFQYYHPDISSLNWENICTCRQYGIGINVWTVNCTEEFNRLYDWECDGAITNYPGLCRQWLRSLEDKN